MYSHVAAIPARYATPAAPVNVHALNPDMKQLNPATSQVQRALILSRNRASYLLAPRRSANDSTVVAESALRALGEVAHEDDRFLLVRLNPRGLASGPR